MSGRIVQIIGAVIDVEFPRDSVPKVYDALKVSDVETILSTAAAGRRRSTRHCHGLH